jgi:cation:H+ antiporter
MNERLDFLRVFGGFVYLLLGGDLLVRGALGLSKRASISPVVVGLTVVAFGTSAPELLTSVYAGLNGFSGVAIGNIVGSNIANVLLVLGLPALIHPIFPRDRALRGQVLFMLGVSAAVVAVSHTGSIGNLEGLALLAVFAGAALVTLRGGVTMPGFDTEDAEEQLNRVLGLPHHPASIALLIALGCIMLPLGAHLTVEGSVAVAHSLGVTHASVGCSVVAFGTSLPELSTTLIAAFHKTSDIALGNVIGSNVFNILLIMGLTSALVEIPVPDSFLSLDLWVMLGVAGLLTLFVVQRRSLGRAWGAVFLGGYVAYLVVIL